MGRGPWRVFLSHTSELRAFPSDRSFVAAAEAAVIRAGHAVTDMAYFAARSSEPAAYCVAKVAEAHVYVAIVGLRYGEPVRGRPDVSYTELEFETATRLGLPLLIFAVREDAFDPSQTNQPAEHAARQEAFRRRLLADSAVTAAWVGAPAELELGLLHALLELGSRPEATASATRTLPRDVATFVGRGQELEQLLAIASAPARLRRGVAISAIDGMAGVGKSAFAIHTAHRLAPEFPDGQLYLDLHAHTAGLRPVAPGDALGSLLLALGVAAQHIPHDIDARAAMWRDRLAGKRMLIVLDDAAGHDQVRPLLPGAPGCLVIITSRRRLAALEDVEPLTLSTLHPTEASELVINLASARRRDAEPATVAELVELCGGLPLAIGLLAGRLRSHSSWTLRHLTETLKTAQDRLAEMHAENIAVEVAFKLSYEDLPSDQQRLFRRLGIHPGREVDAHAAAALDGIGLTEARRRLAALYNDHLIDEPLPGRYRLHDLIREYARTLSSQDDAARNEAAIDRLLDYRLYVSIMANRPITRRSDPATPSVTHIPKHVPNVSTRQDALAWLETERPNLIACLDYAVAHARNAHAVHLAHAMHSYLQIAGHWDQALTIHQTASAIAGQAGDRQSRADALNDLGDMQRLTGQYPAATVSLTESLSLFRSLGSRLGEANARNALGTVQRLTGEYQAATISFTEALALFRELGDRLGRANTSRNLGILRYFTGDYAGAKAVLMEALALFRALGDRLGQAEAVTNVGAMQHLTREHAAAMASLTEGLTLFRELDNRLGQAEALNNLGALLLDFHGPDEAISEHREALRLAREIHAPLEEARALEGIGRYLLRGLDAVGGIAHLRQAQAMYQDLGVPDIERVRTTLADLEGSPDRGG